MIFAISDLYFWNCCNSGLRCDKQFADRVAAVFIAKLIPLFGNNFKNTNQTLQKSITKFHQNRLSRLHVEHFSLLGHQSGYWFPSFGCCAAPALAGTSPACDKHVSYVKLYREYVCDLKYPVTILNYQWVDQWSEWLPANTGILSYYGGIVFSLSCGWVLHLWSISCSHFTKNQDFFNRSKNLIRILFGLSKTPKNIV